jgi:uncharacterized protein (DUF697 family)
MSDLVPHEGGGEPRPLVLPADTMGRVLRWGYRQARDGFGTASGARGLAERHLRATADDPEAAVRRLIRATTGRAGMVGFATSLGGVTALPITLPAGIASTLALQLRMVAAIAVIYGHDLDSDEVEMACTACVLYGGAHPMLQKGGVELAQRIGRGAAARIGRAGALRFGRLVPVLGGVAGGLVDAGATRALGYLAQRRFRGGPIAAEAGAGQDKDEP